MDELRRPTGEVERLAAELGVQIKTGRLRSDQEMIEERLRDAGREQVAAWSPPSRLSRTVTILMAFRVFDHLWFLWFLCWMTIAFALVMAVRRRFLRPRSADVLRNWWIFAWPGALLWLLPVTMLTIAPGDQADARLGVQTSLGLLPIPSVFLHYGIFFAFGALAFARQRTMAGLGRGWPWWLLISAATFFAAMSFGRLRPWTVSLVPDVRIHAMAGLLLDSLYPWATAAAFIGLFGRLASVDRPWVRWLSDSSYFVYLAHLPVVLALQILLAPVPAPAFVKFATVTALTMLLLLPMYQLLVRGSWIGLMLNGRRVRRASCAGT